MDIYFEQLYKRCKQPKDLACQALIFFICVALSGICYPILSFVVPYLLKLPLFIGSVLAMLAIIGIVWVGYKQFMRFNREFEYLYLNGEFDIDCIYTKTERKRIITFKTKDIEVFGEYNSQVAEKYKNVKFDKKFDFASYSKEGKNKVLFAIFPHRNFGKTFIIFEPDERILSDMQRYCKLGTGM